METDSEVELVTRDVEVRSLNPAVKTRFCPSKTRKTKKKGPALKMSAAQLRLILFTLNFLSTMSMQSSKNWAKPEKVESNP